MQWRPREFNKRADYLCNVSLDMCDSYDYIDDNAQIYKDLDAKWMAYRDGGCRGEGWSAFSWIIYACVHCGREWHRFTVAFGY